MRLFAALAAWACEQGLHPLDLTVMAHNTAALSLYQKIGFVIEGTRKDSLRVNGMYVDEYAMAKILARRRLICVTTRPRCSYGPST